MKLLFAIISMTFLLSVGLLAIGAVASLVAIFFGFPVGWGIALSLYCIAFTSSGWKGLSNLGIGARGISNNAEGALCLMHILVLLLGIAFAFSSIPSNTSALWALLLPLVILPALAVQWFFEILLNVVNNSGKRA